MGRGDARRSLTAHVLARFDADEQKEMEAAVERAADAVETFVEDGIDRMMNRSIEAARLLAAVSRRPPSPRGDQMSETRQYEVVYVVSPEITEEGVTELHERIAEIVGQLGGAIDKTDNWGRRRLAYEINRHREGTYVIELVTGPGTLVTELDRRLRVMEQLLRHLIVRVDEDLRKARRARERRQSRQQRRLSRKAPAGLGAPAAPADADAPAAASTVRRLPNR